MKVFISFLLIFCIHSVVAGRYRSEHDVTQQFLKYATNNQLSEDKEELRKLTEILSFPKYATRDSFSSYSDGRQGITCMLCRAAMNTFLNLLDEGYTEEVIIEVATDLCIMLEIQPENVCRGVVKLNAPIILYVAQNEPRFNTESFCGVVLQTRKRSSCPYEDERYEWSVEIPQRENPVSKNERTRIPNFNIVQISDNHYDPSYKPDSLATCDEPICCREGQTKRESRGWKGVYDDSSSEDRIHQVDGKFFIDINYVDEVKSLKKRALREEQQESDSPGAGYWGDYRNCDVPWWSFEDSIGHIAETHLEDIEYIYYTGDTIDHAVWDTTQSEITASLVKTLDKFKEKFRSKPLFPIIGNHESQPLNQFAPSYITDPKFSTNWLYELLADKWTTWLPADTKEDILNGGYYSVRVKPGFRIIALNSNVCYVYNWWIHLDPVDLSGQLKWLIKTLLKAERNGENVHILSHIPAGVSDCFHVYTREYNRIVERFSDTIVAEFNGHTHKDEFKIFYEKNNISNALNVGWNGGSLTPYSNVNPNYRIYEVNGKNFEIYNYENWIYNLTEANLHPNRRPEWFKEYSFKEFYGVNSLKSADIDKLVHRMMTNEKSLFETYHFIRGKSSDEFVKKPCDESCQNKNLCYMVSTEVYDERKCEKLWELYQSGSP